MFFDFSCTMAEVRKSKRRTKGLKGPYRASMLTDLPSFDLNVSNSPLEAVKKKRNRCSALVENSQPVMVDSSSLGKHSEISFVTHDSMSGVMTVPAHNLLSSQSVLVQPDTEHVHSVRDVSVHVSDNPAPEGEVFNSDSESDMPIFGVIPTQSHNQKSSEFFTVDQGVLNQVLNDKTNPSEGVDNWCRNRFNAWRKAKGMDTSKSIEYYWDHLKEFGQILTVFFLEVAKVNGKRYPTESLMGLYNAFNRILCAEQRKRCIEQNKTEPIFEIEKHPFFLTVNRAVNESMTMSVNAGANKGRKKARGLTFEDEVMILSHPSHQVTFARGLLKRVVYYCTIIFYVRGNSEMHNLRYCDFQRGENNAGFTYIK